MTLFCPQLLLSVSFPETSPEQKQIYCWFTAMEDFSVSLLILQLIYTARVFIFQETEAAVQAKQPNVEEVLSKGCHLYKEKPATHPVKVMKQPLAISITA